MKPHHFIREQIEWSNNSYIYRDQVRVGGPYSLKELLQIRQHKFTNNGN